VSETTAARRRAKPARSKSEAEGGTSQIDLGPLDDYIAFHLRMTQETALRAFIASSRRPEFKPGHFATLMVVKRNPGVSQIEVCRAIGRDKSTISPIIRELGNKGLLLRDSSPTDRRSVLLRLTPKGEAALEKLLEDVEAHDRRLDAIVGKSKPMLIALLKKIAAALS
jgi:DNA-binding MarR family transcriptional regulator